MGCAEAGNTTHPPSHVHSEVFKLPRRVSLATWGAFEGCGRCLDTPQATPSPFFGSKTGKAARPDFGYLPGRAPFPHGLDATII